MLTLQGVPTWRPLGARYSGLAAPAAETATKKRGKICKLTCMKALTEVARLQEAEGDSTLSLHLANRTFAILDDNGWDLQL